MSYNPPIIDGHCDVVLPFQDLGSDFATLTTNTQTSLPLLKQANVKIIFAGFSYDDLLKDSMQQFDNLHKMLELYPDDFELILDWNQIPNIMSGQKIGVILHLEGAGILDGNIQKLHNFYNRGLRSLGFTHNTKNSLGTGALVDDQQGLTDFGKKVVKVCNELNIILDLAHLNEAGFYDVINLSKQTPIVSHGNSYSITQNPRNFKDDQLKKIAEIDSFIGIFFSGKFLKADDNPNGPELEDAVKHLDHMIKVAGIDHVGLGPDFGGITTSLPNGLEDHSKLANLFDRLEQKGYSKEDLDKLAYKNALRVISRYDTRS